MTEKNKQHEKFRLSLFSRIMLCLIAVYYILALLSFPLKTVSYTVHSSEVSEEITIVQISDLHSYSYGKDMKTLINATDKAKPDIIVLTGDIYDDIRDNENTRTLLRNLGSRYKCFYVAGNHELRTPLWSGFKAEAEGFGITVMEGDTAAVGGITICGAAGSPDNETTHYNGVRMCAKNAEGFSVILSHFPEDIDYYRSFGCFDLILCGHAHGGQWRIPLLLNGVYSPGKGIFPKYAGGRFDFDDCTMIVSRGLARELFPVARIFNNPELAVIKVCPE